MNYQHESKAELVERLNQLQHGYNHLKGLYTRIIASNKQSDLIIANSKSILKSILKIHPEIIVFSLNANYQYIAFNKNHSEVIKKIWGKEISIGSNILGDIIGNHNDREKAKINFDRALSGESFVITEEYGEENLSRSYWQNYYSPIYSADRKIVGLNCLVQNVLENKKAETFTGEQNEDLFQLIEQLHQTNDGLLQERESLNERNVRNMALLKSLPDMIFVLDEKGVFLDFKESDSYNPISEPITFIGKNVADIMPPDIAEITQIHLDLLFQSSEKQLFEYQLEENGKPKFYECRLADVGNKKAIAIVRDITERKKNENALNESRANLLALIENTSEHIWVINTEYEIEFCNHEFEMAFLANYNFRLVKGTKILDAIPPELNQVWKARYDRALKNERFIFEEDFIYMGNPTYYEVSMNPIVINDSVIGVSCFTRNITERKNDELALKASEENLKTAQSLGNVGHWEYNILDDQLNWSEQIFRIYELSPTDFEPSYSKVVTLFHPEDRQKVEDEFQKSIENKTNLEIEHRIITPSGQIKYIVERASTKYDEQGKPVIAIGSVADITQHKLAEAEIQKQNNQLKELNATKDKFFTIIAHDLKGPLGSFVNFCEILLEKMDTFDHEKLAYFLDIMKNSADQSYKLLENLLQWSRLQRGLLIPSLSKQNLKNLISEVEFSHINIAKNKQISIETRITDDIFGHCDAEMTKTILRNLISNAIKFTERNGRVIINAIRNDDEIEVTILDNGVGISMVKMPFLFRIEKNISTCGTDEETGTGLGLLLCKELIEKQGGKIWVKSEEGKGSEFSFTLKKSLG